MLNMINVVTGVVAAGGIGYMVYSCLEDLLSPYRIKDFDGNIKAIMQDVGIIEKDVDYIKALNRAKSKRGERLLVNSKTTFMQDCIDKLASNNKLKIKVWVYGEQEVVVSQNMDYRFNSFSIHIDNLYEMQKEFSEIGLTTFFSDRETVKEERRGTTLSALPTGAVGLLTITYFD